MPHVSRLVSFEYRFFGYTVFLEYISDTLLMFGRKTDFSSPHTVELAFPDLEDDFELYILSLIVWKVVEQMADAISVTDGSVAQVFITRFRLSDKMRIDNLYMTYGNWNEFSCLIA